MGKDSSPARGMSPNFAELAQMMGGGEAAKKAAAELRMRV